MDEKQVEDIKNAIDISSMMTGESYEDIISKILIAKEQGKNVYVTFPNGAKLYSLIDDENSCYLKLFGKDKTSYAFDKLTETIDNVKLGNSKQNEKLEAVTDLVKRAKQVIYSQRLEDWEKDLNDAANSESKLNLMMHKSALEIIEFLASGNSFEATKYKMKNEQGHSNHSYYRTLSIIAWYSKQGPDFLEYAEPEMAKNSNDILKQIREENQKFEAESENN